MAKISKEKFWELYKTLPQELKDALFAEETGNKISDICIRNEIEEKMGDVVDYVGQVLVGILPPENFSKTIEKELSLKNSLATKVGEEIGNLIFLPVMTSLDVVYGKTAPPEEPMSSHTRKTIPGDRPVTEKSIEGPDSYREPTE